MPCARVALADVPAAPVGLIAGRRLPVVVTRPADEAGPWLKGLQDQGFAPLALPLTHDQPGVAAAIVGARYADHLGDTLAVFGLQLDAQDHALLEPLLAAHPGPEGDTYTLERDKTGRHGRIMKYNLNKS